MKFYQAAEDSKLLLKSLISNINKFENKNVLEVGVGSGFVIKNFSVKFPNNFFYGVDINADAIKETKKEFKNIKLKKGNLMQPFKQKRFDLVFFNTPYLPCEEGEKYDDLTLKDKAIYGGKHGYEVIELFLNQINQYLSLNGQVFMLFSSLSNKEYIEQVLERNLLSYEYVGEESHFFETLYVIKIIRKEVLNNILNVGVSNLNYFNKGKHSVVFEGIYNNKNVLIKIGKPQHLEKEGFFLEKLKDEWFVPKLYLRNNEFVVREKFEGDRIIDFLEIEESKKKISYVFNKVLGMSFRLDELGINKFEMTNPYKHIFIKKKKVLMIDYERCIFSDKPKNLTQFFQYIRRNNNLLQTKGIYLDENKIFDISKKYKKKIFKFKFEDLTMDGKS